MRNFLEYCKYHKIKENTQRFEWARYVYMDVIREIRGELIHNPKIKDVDNLLGERMASAMDCSVSDRREETPSQ